MIMLLFGWLLLAAFFWAFMYIAAAADIDAERGILAPPPYDPVDEAEHILRGQL